MTAPLPAPSPFRPSAGSFKTKARREAEFDSAPRSPREIKDHAANEARMERLAREHHARVVGAASERYRDAMSDLADVTHAMNVGGAKTIPGRRSQEEHLKDIQRLHTRIKAAEHAAVLAAEAVAAVRGKDPTEVYEAWVRSNPYLADRVS